MHACLDWNMQATENLNIIMRATDKMATTYTVLDTE